MKVVLLVGALFTSSAQAFTLVSSTSSNFRGWADPHIRLQINTSNCPAVDIEGIMKEAAKVWNHVATSRVKVTIDGSTSATTHGNPIPVVCDTNYGSGNPGIANGSPGAASVFPSSGDYITGGIMYLNASAGTANIANLSRKMVSVVLAHEIGHLIGLGHSQDTKALMYYDAQKKEHLALAQDDIDGITYLYPRNEFGGDDLAGCGRVGSIDSAIGGGGGMKALTSTALLLLPFVLLIYHRRRRPFFARL